MATEAPDAHSLKAWQEAFQYQIPTVRRIEQELRRDVISNREKLRSLVGLRYRDLLDTAQTIIEMNEEIKQVERNLSEVGRCCNPATIAQKSASLHRLREDNLEKVSSDRTFASQLTLLSNCVSAISRILRQRGSTVVAAKLLVISRLLHNSLSQSTRATHYVKRLWNQLTPLRYTLSRRIDLRLASLDSSVQNIIESLSAFCLATSSSADDALGHFHKVRSEAIKRKIEGSCSLSDCILEALILYRDTLRKTADILSGPLFDALKKLTSHPLLDDPKIQCMGDLGLDMVQLWISKEIRNFTPWIKHDQISKQASAKAIRSWSIKAFEELVSQAKVRLAQCENFQEILSVRSCLLNEWLPVMNLTPCHSPIKVLEGIRALVNDQLVSILRAQSKDLTFIGDELSSTLDGWSNIRNHDLELSLWDPDLVFVDFSDGATLFKHELVKRTQGQGSHVLEILDVYQTWLTAVSSRSTMIQDLKSERWEDIMEDDVDEESLETVTGLLKEDDPHLLQTEHAESLLNGYKLLQSSLSGAIERIEEPHGATQTAFLLRITRAIRSNIPNEVAGQNFTFAQDLVPKLHRILGQEISSRVSASALTGLLSRSRKRCPGRTLWEGDPPLPTQPSQAAFKFLRELAVAMEQQGADLWNILAVDELKLCTVGQIIADVSSSLAKQSTTAEAEQDTADVEEGEEDEQKDLEPDFTRDHKIQLLFDLLYLSCAFSTTASNVRGGLDALISSLVEALRFEDSSMNSLSKRSQEYWKRTQLLFGLLA
ncbi:hypothetical protein D8B26_007261 [Coccidioides posadasii str. Silveira]|uniref:Conserved oligomeric Golgi complex subunit 1 n=2 Tax=Coccidioides posadasii TaxID=199306 RepID=E9D387_COCPS|nr:hypothetical protein CPC735_013050 [Coccidioides posadasii C735 delta SOWgp]EER29987.1 hypothetical protein CPC735_013050 [Coccidioides posadasii C735 delta SOWgp]EFW19082.1 conserved hypothetical protein [Coccidioides posadasii str. Silveira]QVM12642.1 hypothetical protein D8B26_007261 [Coccidioides posadasii str. Silveira]|eukprot:XP_003072132.1 hypothetical protein CPC735_013050 [Coccidioides posadasii C735 delta SOWgp]